MRVLVISQYFAPEAGATQNRMAAFVSGLVDRGHQVTVVCEQPCHPGGVFHPGFGRRPVVTERAGPVTIHRLWVAASPRKTTWRRLAFYATFGVGAAATVLAGARHEVILATSPPLPGVLAVAAAARLRRTPIVIDVRDIWPAAAEALGELSNRRIIRMFERAERALYRAAARVTATTRPFCEHVDAVAGVARAVHLPNGALDALVREEPPPAPDSEPFVVGYAGNLGIAQGLGIVLAAAEVLRDQPVRFALVGDGAEKEALLAERDRRGLSNVSIDPPIPTADIARFLYDANALLIPLRDHNLLGDFIPSKLYDAMAAGRPALVAVRGQAAALVSEAEAGIVVPPEDGRALAEAVLRLRGDRGLCERLGNAGRASAGHHARSRQLALLEAVLVAAAGLPPVASREAA